MGNKIGLFIYEVVRPLVGHRIALAMRDHWFVVLMLLPALFYIAFMLIVNPTIKDDGYRDQECGMGSLKYDC